MEKGITGFFEGRAPARKAACALVFFAAVSLAGCGSQFQSDSNAIYVQKNGEIVSVAVEEFKKDYYSEEELRSYVEGKIADYQKDHDKDSVEMEEFSVEDGVAKLRMRYDSAESYQDMNGVTLFTGTIPQALAEGFDFDAEFTKIQDKAAAGTVDKKEVVEMDSKIVILSEKVDVKVDGTIRYMSSDYTAIKDTDTVSIRLPEDADDGEDQALSYIIYED